MLRIILNFDLDFNNPEGQKRDLRVKIFVNARFLGSCLQLQTLIVPKPVKICILTYKY